MAQIHSCEDSSDAISLYAVLGLFLKPIARINITIHYPALKNSIFNGGKSVSSWELMEKIKALTLPDHYIQLRIVKNTLEFIRFEGDVENRDVLKSLMTRLEGKALKLTGFKEPFKVRSQEAKLLFPSKYDWDSYFRDAKHMNEMKAGERPDTIHFQHLPCKWFSQRKNDEKPQPSEKYFRRVWETFGEIRSVDIPMLDPYRQKMNSNIPGIKTFTFNIDSVFDAYVQYKDYMSFVKAMDALRGMFLLYQENNKHWIASVKVDFDKSKHLSDDSVKKRQLERDRLMNLEKEEQFAKLKELRELQSVKSQSKNNKSKEDRSIFDSEDEEKMSRELEHKIEIEERKYVIARRKLEAIRLIDYLFEVVKFKLEAKKRAKKLKRKAELKKLKKKRKKGELEHFSSEDQLESSDEYDSGKERDKSERFTQVIGRYKEIHEYKVEQQEKKLRKVRPSQRSLTRSRSRTRSPVNLERSPERNRRHSSHGEHSDDLGPRRRRSDSYHSNHNTPVHNRYINDWEIGVKHPMNGRRPVMPDNYRKPPLLPNPDFPPMEHQNHYRPMNDHFMNNNYRGRGTFQRRGYNNRHHSFPHPHGYPGNFNARGFHGHEQQHERPYNNFHGPSYQEELEQAYEKYFKSVTLRNTEEKKPSEEENKVEDISEVEEGHASPKSSKSSRRTKSVKHKKTKKEKE